MNYRTYDDLSRDTKKSLPKIADVDLIVGIPRSGMIPAYMIGAFLNSYVCTLEEFVNGDVFSKGERPIKKREIKKVLVVDDSINTGAAMAVAQEKLEAFRDKYEFVFMAVYATEESCRLVDVYADICPNPRFFQWNYLYHPGILPYACLDIDGVLCVDPTEEENDDGEKYREFLLNAKPLFIPNCKVKALVTSRLEKYRPETEAWMKKHGVVYEQLIMLDLPSKAERIRLGAHAPFKAEVYTQMKDSKLFIESNPQQARKIFELTGKMTVCTETDELFYWGMPTDREKVLRRTVSVSRKKFGKAGKAVIRKLCYLVPFRKWRRNLRSLYK